MRALYLGVLGLALTCLTFPVHAKMYRNAEYGFSVRFSGQPTCVGEPYEHSHGIDIFLDGGPAVCGHLDERPFISVNASYSDAGEFTPSHVPSAREEAEWYCGEGGVVKPPEFLRIDGHKSGSCRVDKDGWINIIVIAQAWRDLGGPSNRDDEADWISYSAELQTTADHLDHDLVQFRAVLKSIRIFRPEGR
jgi:hypothetical protein